jgi:ATP-binding cassette subfamily F protein uup
VLAQATPAPATPPALRRRNFRENRELEALERDLPAWESRRAALEGDLAGAGALGHGEIEQRSRELAELLERIAAAEERWLALSELPA